MGIAQYDPTALGRPAWNAGLKVGVLVAGYLLVGAFVGFSILLGVGVLLGIGTDPTFEEAVGNG